ncbi:MAG: peptide MFS transporter [Bacteroidales bacterium]|jgi:POT family proton-dependent oligopeptide transporter|nr:peptide MFS transporter [Bacteroidales bacterium]MBP5214831.1 peptide MFS transporter [Bacteroidales bacterium]
MSLTLSVSFIVVLFAIWLYFLYISYKGQPKGLWVLAIANTGERFGYYTMLAVFALFLGENFGFEAGTASEIYTWFLTLVYFLPLFGGMLADKFGFNKMVVTGIVIMFLGYLLLSLPLGGDATAVGAMLAALALVSAGTGLFKGNLQVMVGDLYNAKEFADKRDSGFSLFYMAINVGALFAPTAAIGIMDWAQQSLAYSKADSYHFAFAVACASVVFSIIVYFAGIRTFSHVLNVSRKKDVAAVEAAPEDPKETRERIVCLALVYAVVIFFWMAFHQNGLTLTWFADEFTARSSTGLLSMLFDVKNLLACIFVVYGLFGIFQNKGLSRLLAALLIVLGSAYFIMSIPAEGSVTEISAPIFQHFNACFVVMLTPVSIALFGWLANMGKEPKAPFKIGLGMLVAGAAYLMLTVACLDMPAPNHPEHVFDASPSLLVNTYLILTFAELLLSPIGISFVTKVSPAKYKGMMMGGWFVATALGNKLVAVAGHMWDLPLPIVWGVLMGICLLAAAFIFAIIKRLNKVA